MPEIVPLNRATATGPMAQEARKAYEKTRQNAAKEYEIELTALRKQFLSDQQFHNAATKLHAKHMLKAQQMENDWNQRMTMIDQYEKLSAAGTIPTEEARRSQYALSGYEIEKQRRTSDFREEHRKLITERERLEEMLWPYARKTGWGGKEKGPYRIVKTLHQSGAKKGQPKKLGREVTDEELAQIEAIQQKIREYDQAEYTLMQQTDPMGRKINQLTRAMAMGPPIHNTPGIGGNVATLPIVDSKGKTVDAEPPPEQYTTTKNMTINDAIQQAHAQLGENASKERVIALAKQIYGNK